MATSIYTKKLERRGYSPPDDPARHNRHAWRSRIAEIRREVRAAVDMSRYERPRPGASIAMALGSVAATLLAGTAVVWAYESYGLIAAVPAYVVATFFIARQQRTLELLVHDGSHRAFSRNLRVNNLLCDIVAAAPVLQSAKKYAKSHLWHHSQFGGEHDPCRNRPSMTAIRAVRGKGPIAWLKTVISSMPAYLSEYYKGVASSDRRVLSTCVLWHSVVVAGLAALFGPGLALLGWLLFWAVPFTTLLPVLRMQAEADEHDYETGCEASGTFTNLGFLNGLWVHPASDQYHLAHHAFPAVSLTLLARLDHQARAKCPSYAAMPVRRR